LGGEGAIAYDPAKGRCLRVPALEITPIDTVGAGDAFVGAFAAYFHDRQDLGECLRRGAVAGGLTCLGPGAQESVPDQAMIEARVGEITVEEI
jgi:ribokinase